MSYGYRVPQTYSGGSNRSYASGRGGGAAHSFSRKPSGGFLAPSYSGVFGQRFTSKLTAQEKEIIDVAFESFKDENNFITTERLKAAFKQIDALGDIESVQRLIDDIDENGDGKIDEDEFRHIMTRKFLGEDDDSSFIHAFEMLDENRDGFIPLVEMRHHLMREGANPLSEAEVDELLMFADLEGDGLIDYRTFLRWLSNPDAPNYQMRH